MAFFDLPEIPRINETKQTNINREMKNKPGKKCTCIYYPEEACTIPLLKFRICHKCPRAQPYISKNVVASVFDHIKALSITLMNQMRAH
ncbi:MAG: hypothetical protein HQ596_06220 [Candidatus Saganbacteria bacterium]|nr:hypothetical protein [Candidatus Saganbacteria bacterium]